MATTTVTNDVDHNTDSTEESTTDPTPHESSAPTGQEQLPLILISLFLTVAAIVFGCIYRWQYPEYQQNAGFYIVTSIQTFLAFMLPVAYPGFACFAYTAGLGHDGPGTRFEAFYIDSTMGMVLGIESMAFVDHLMFVFAPLVAILGWMPWIGVQVIASALACLCGVYMSLWIPTNVAMKNGKDPAPWVMLIVFATCSIYRVFDLILGDDTNTECGIVLGAFDGITILLSLTLIINALRRIHRVEKTLALVTHLHNDIGEGPVWVQWPKDKEFPKDCWWFEPTVRARNESSGSDNDGDGNGNGDNKGVWPYGQWPSENNSTNPSQEVIEAAADEMKEEMPRFMPLWLVLSVLLGMIIVLIVAVSVLC